jgi:hypothetical protein
MPEWTDVASSIATGVGAVATAVGAFAVWWQISDAKMALYATNSYAVHKDLIEALDQVEEAQASKGNSAPALQDNLRRQVRRLDGLMEAAAGLYNNAGLSTDTWRSILSGICPSFSSNYQIAGSQLRATQTACESNKPLWEHPPK